MAALSDMHSLAWRWSRRNDITLPPWHLGPDGAEDLSALSDNAAACLYLLS